jgi:hypothetical protein
MSAPKTPESSQTPAALIRCTFLLAFLFNRLISFLRPCRGDIIYLAAESLTSAGEFSAASGVGISSMDFGKIWMLKCSRSYERCKLCPRLHALRQSSSADQRPQNRHVPLPTGHSEPQVTDGNGYVAEIGNFDAHSFRALGREKPNRNDSKLDPIAAESSPGVNDAENGSKKPESQTRDGRDERDILHGAFQANSMIGTKTVHGGVHGGVHAGPL